MMNRTRRILTAAACLPAALLIGLGMAGTASAQTVNCPSVNLNSLASTGCKAQYNSSSSLGNSVEVSVDLNDLDVYVEIYAVIKDGRSAG
ncbi:hypothetical protein [Nocardia sp. NRRL S-836]|uniref:hypothetical protein n=1 Tax=Nocardia sp. NRRL S-836 TaxID=1519492 RepID=UPI0012F70BEC|nr:hypothetical protein [Nocardia sp. NRRL S-836]